jgi:hypothetical protein
MRLRQKMPWKYMTSWAMKFIYSLRTGVILRNVILSLQSNLKGNVRSCTSGIKSRRMMRRNKGRAGKGKTVAKEMPIEKR